MGVMRKNILITGASSGLGRQMAREFAARGASLALCARRLDRLEELKAELAERHPDITVAIRTLDVTDTAAVFDVVKAFRSDLGSLDRVVVNAGLGKGQPLGTGRFDANLQTAQTNFIGALAQIEAAMEVFREQRSGHLVIISSVSALRGLPRNLTTYAATKAGVAALGEGLRAELMRGKAGDIVVSTIYPGYISSEMNEKLKRKPAFMVGTEQGTRAIVAAIEKEKASARVPSWPWVPLGAFLKVAPMSVVSRFG
jgi:short-subunit dehydrogenase